MMDYSQDMVNERYPAMSASAVQNLTDVRLCSVGWTDEKYREFYEIAQVVTGLIIYPLACTLGVVGNALTIFVLSRRNMLTSTNAFLSALAVSDSIKLINDSMYILVTVLLRTDHDLGKVAYGYLYPYAHFFFSMSVSVSSWLTVSVAVERYILICHPTRARAFWNRRRAIYLCVSIYLVMTLLSLPSALRYRTIKCVDRKTSLTRVDVELTEIWQNQSLVTAYEWIQNLLRSTIPSLLLIVLNVCIISALKRTKVKRRNPRHRVTVMMIVVILVFLICITPDATLSTFFGFGYHEASYLGKAIREITDCLLTINAGVNFIIYCAFNQTFRKSFAQICCFNKPPTGWVTELDESVYRRLSEAKYLLSTNNNSSPRQTTPNKVTVCTAHHNGQSGYCPEEGVNLVTLNQQSKSINCQLESIGRGEIRRHSSPLISSSSSSTEPENLQPHHQHHHPHHHRLSSSSGLKKSKNSVKSNRNKKKQKVTFIDNPEVGQKMDADNKNGHQFTKSYQEDISRCHNSPDDIFGDNLEADFVNPCRNLSTNLSDFKKTSNTDSRDCSKRQDMINQENWTHFSEKDCNLRNCVDSQSLSRGFFSENTFEEFGKIHTSCELGNGDVWGKDSVKVCQVARSESAANIPTISVDSEIFLAGGQKVPGRILIGRQRKASRDVNTNCSNAEDTPIGDIFDENTFWLSSCVSAEILTNGSGSAEILTTDV